MKQVKRAVVVILACVTGVCLERETQATVFNHPDHKCENKMCTDLACISGGNTCIHSERQFQWAKCFPNQTWFCQEDTDNGPVECSGTWQTGGGNCTCVYNKCDVAPPLPVPGP